MKKGFSATKTGFCLTFPNGKSVSVQWGKGTYSSGKDMAEVLVFGPTIDGDLIGWQSPEQVAEIIAKVAAEG